jgi:predicted RNase H-like HicB family nuclease
MVRLGRAICAEKRMIMERYTAIFERGEDGWWVASCLEMPEAITQGATIDEARENLKDAIHLLLEVRREEAEKELEGRDVIREPLVL